ncbi:MAG TPA: biosynthetic peptidoglycan transglycosylase, partial [Chthonomonadaceae bacterium]|nr:biosynthetic peptidoglycan transglycosylase [Chthonomonadaceae bacterium]
MVRPRPLSRAARVKRFLALCMLAVLSVVAGVLVYGVWLVRSLNAHLPGVTSLADVRADSVTTIYSSDGVPLAGFRTRYRLPVALSEISPYLVQATIATEDSRFYAHHGVDFRAIGRALLSDLHAGGAYQQGASTITQQLARDLYLTQDKTFKRKIEEMLLA